MRALKLGILRLARSLGFFALSRRLTARGVRILCYHGLWLGEDGFSGDAMFMRRETFEARLGHLRAQGYPVVSLDDAVAALRDGRELPPAAVVITIDDGWYSTFSGMVPALVRYGMSATLYCDSAALEGGLPIAHVMARYLKAMADPAFITAAAEARFCAAIDFTRSMAERLDAARDFCTEAGIDAGHYERLRVFGYMTPAELRSARDAGLTIELHTHNHSLGACTGEEVRSEIAANRAALGRLLEVDPSTFSHFCYPSGVTSPEAAAALDALGMASSTTTVAGLAVPGSPLQLLPRFLDGEQVSAIEFEAELSGFMPLLRPLVSRLKGMRRREETGLQPVFVAPAN